MTSRGNVYKKPFRWHQLNVSFFKGPATIAAVFPWARNESEGAHIVQYSRALFLCFFANVLRHFFGGKPNVLDLRR